MANTQYESGKPAKRVSFTRKAFLIGLLVIIILFGAFYLWKYLDERKLKKEHTAKVEEMELKHREQMNQVQADMLRVFAKPYVWAVRKEMMQGNLEQVNLYGTDMVQERNFDYVVVANNEGTIVSSTDKKYEGKPFGDLQGKNLLGYDSTHLQSLGDTVLILSSPVMSFNSRLGTVVMKYKVK